MSSIIKRLVGLAITIAIGFVLNYLCLPAWNARNASMWFFLLVVSSIGLLIQHVIDEIDWELEHSYGTIISAIVCGIFASILLVGGFLSSHLLNSGSYRNMITVSNGDFEKDINPITNVNNISIVDVETARNIGDRTIGSIQNSAWFNVEKDFNLVKFQGKKYRISSLKYGDFFKAEKAKEVGIPGYVLVDTTTQEAKFVQLENPMKYVPSGNWNYNLKRHLRKQFSDYMFGTSFFEIDEEGNPYYITSVQTPTIGLFGGKKEDSFIITNPISGECVEYLAADLPEWVDHAYDLDYLMRVTKYNLSYIHGFLNFSQTDVLRTTFSYRSTSFVGYNTAITSDSEIVFYTGLTPANNAESNVGFILANPRTGVITKYTCAGAEESSAQSSAEGLVQELGYTATFPTILNVDGNETYFMLLKDKAGLVQRYVLCNVKNYTQVVQSNTLQSALELYRVKIGVSASSDQSETLKVQGQIKELYTAQVEGNTYFYFTIVGSNNLYMSSIKNSNRQVQLKEGDSVSIEYVPSSEDGVYIVQKIQ